MHIRFAPNRADQCRKPKTEYDMTSKITPEKVESLRHELSQIRQASLQASRKGDFMRVARLTPRAAQINKAIMDAEAQMLADL